MCPAEGPGSRGVVGVGVSSTSRGQADCGGVEGEEPAQDGHHRHVRYTVLDNHLVFIHIHVCSDPYVKIYLLHKDQRISKKKTHVKKRTLNPVFNESFVFDLPRTDNGLADIQLEFALLDWDRVTKNEVL